MNEKVFDKNDEVFNRNDKAKTISDVKNVNVNKKNYILNILIIESDIENLSSRFRSHIRFNI